MAKTAKRTAKTGPRRRPARPKPAGAHPYGAVQCALGSALSLWLFYGTLTLSPFRWGVLAEELIVAVCAVCALRLLCVARPSKAAFVAAAVVLPAGIALFGAYAAVTKDAPVAGFLCAAAAALSAVLCARTLSGKPDGAVLCALLLLAAMPGILTESVSLREALMCALLTAGVTAAVSAVRMRSVPAAFAAAALLGLAGAMRTYAAVCAVGAAAGMAFAGARKRRGAWMFAAALTAALPFALYLLAAEYGALETALAASCGLPAAAWTETLRPHVLRTLALGLLPFSLRRLKDVDRAALPALLALLGGAAMRLAFGADAPGLWADVPALTCLSGVGIASIGTRNG